MKKRRRRSAAERRTMVESWRSWGKSRTGFARELGSIHPAIPSRRPQPCWDSRRARHAAGSNSRTRLAGQLFSLGRTSLRYNHGSMALTMCQTAPGLAPLITTLDPLDS